MLDLRQYRPIIMVKDLHNGKVFEFGTSSHDRLVISDDNRKLTYLNLQNGDGSSCGDYEFYFEHDPDLDAEYDFYERGVPNQQIESLENIAEDCMGWLRHKGYLNVEDNVEAFTNVLNQMINELRRPQE